MTKPLPTDEAQEITGLSPDTLAPWRWLKLEIPYQIAAEKQEEKYLGGQIMLE